MPDTLGKSNNVVDLAWLPVKTSSASGRIVMQIRQALFDDLLTPGDHLGSEADLAEKFGVSRLPVRDAVRTLQAMGIVEVRVGAKGGIFVSKGDPARAADALAVQLKLIGLTLDELADAQMAIEGMAAELAARNATPDDLNYLTALLDEMAGLTANPQAFLAKSILFHLGVAEASHSRALAAYFQVLGHILHANFARSTSKEITPVVWQRHRQLLDLLIERKPEAARAQMCTHIAGVRAEMNKRQKPQP